MTKVRGAFMNANITKAENPHWYANLAVRRDIIPKMCNPTHAKDVSSNWEVKGLTPLCLTTLNIITDLNWYAKNVHPEKRTN